MSSTDWPIQLCFITIAPNAAAGGKKSPPTVSAASATRTAARRPCSPAAARGLRPQGTLAGEPVWSAESSALSCAIYTRGWLEQGVNSLRALRKSSEAFAKSQHGEG